MLRLALPADEAMGLCRDSEAVVACRTAASTRCIAGSAAAIATIAADCAARHIENSRLAVSHAFHSPDMEAAMVPLAAALENFPLQPVTAPVVSTITGAPLAPEARLRRLLVDQLTQPVLFDRALEELAKYADILVEVGPGHGLTRLAREWGLTAMSVDALGKHSSRCSPRSARCSWPASMSAPMRCLQIATSAVSIRPRRRASSRVRVAADPRPEASNPDHGAARDRTGGARGARAGRTAGRRALRDRGRDRSRNFPLRRGRPGPRRVPSQLARGRTHRARGGESHERTAHRPCRPSSPKRDAAAFG